MPYERRIVVRGEANGVEIQRHVCVLSGGRMAHLDIPPGVPCIQRTDQLPFPLQWSARVMIEDAGRAAASPRSAIRAALRRTPH